MAIDNCGLLTANLGIDCDNPIVSGVNDRLIIMNKPDIIGYTYGASKEIIAAITLASGKTAFSIQGKNDSIDPQTELEKARFSTNQNHQVNFRIFDNSVAVKTQVNLMMNGRYVCLIQNNHVNTSGNSAFEVYGEIAGLELAEGSRMPNEVEMEGGWNLILRTPERAKEPRVPASFFDTDFATTLANAEGLLA